MMNDMMGGWMTWGMGPRGPYRDRRDRSLDRGARQISVLSLTHAPVSATGDYVAADLMG
ncbi:hypothetical protein [Rhizobium gallicum]|uniref:hypothetical protein n=1 Tax=Rhizobium gallicum TaxID=56730 RepID=UPI001EF87470|nr:hypothetical protein [Rhizobium gallicum]ULJ74182.1 hypothetical protein L2W42_08830 [Rhizobium gallicum]